MSAEAKAPEHNYRVEHYQNDSDVVASVFIKKLKPEDVSVTFDSQKVFVVAKLPDGSSYERALQLAHEVNAEQCTYKVLSTKIEIKLRKKESIQWAALEAVELPKAQQVAYPSSSKKKTDWDKVEKEIIQQEGDDPDVNSLFSKIYEAGDDNTKKAMMKSMLESGGTVLSTNWEDIGSRKVEVSPPDGMEWKKY